MIDCRDVELMLQDYLDGYLLPSQKEILELHVRDCAACRDLLVGVMRMDRRLEMVGQVEAPGDLSAAILNALPPADSGPSRLRRTLTLSAVPLVAVLTVALGVLLKNRHEIRTRAVDRRVEIVYAAPQAASVAIAGDFNGWDPRRTLLVRSSHEGKWRAILSLPPGVYQYSFVIDGDTWVTDPQAKTTLADGFGGENSVMVVDG